MKKYAPLKPMSVDECVSNAIKRQVEIDDIEAWGKKPSEEFKVVPPMAYEKPKNRTLMQYLIYQWLP